MSIHKRYVCGLLDLKNILLEQGSDSFYKKYSKPDVLIGPVDSIKFIDSFMKEYLD
jgi:hypothetical protein|tara:strand:- start:822 stop:989 length:168 start_codon:yes stop_codon:yes gene_type:complete